jgi:hypothetical protein
MGQSIKVDVEAIRKASEALTAAEMASLTVLLALASKRHVELPELLEAIHALIPEGSSNKDDAARQAAIIISEMMLRE